MSGLLHPFMIVGAFVCLLSGFGFSIVGVDALHEALHTSATPLEIPCSQLRSFQPRTNKHVTLTEFVPYPEGILALKYKDRRSWSVWVPILPANAPQDDPTHIVAVVALSGICDMDSLRRALAEDRWTGILLSQGDLEPYTANFCQLNPGINIGSCWMMRQDRDGHPPDHSSAIAEVIACPLLFVLGMVLAVMAALRPVPAPDARSAPVLGAMGDAVRWLHRRGYLSARAAILLAAVGCAVVAAAGYIVYRDWNNVVRVTTEMHLAIIGVLIGMGLLAYAVLLGFARWKTTPNRVVLGPNQRIQDQYLQADPRQMPAVMVAVGLVLLTIAANHFYHSAVSLWSYVFASLGLVVLGGGAIWFGLLSWKMEYKKARFWN